MATCGSATRTQGRGEMEIIIRIINIIKPELLHVLMNSSNEREEREGQRETKDTSQLKGERSKKERGNATP